MSLEHTPFTENNLKLEGIYRAKVEDNNDPSQLGQIKARVYPWFASMEITNIPWARPAMSLFEGAVSGAGNFCVPRVGSFVYVFFEHGDMYSPVYFAEAQTAVHGLPSERTTNYPNRKIIKTVSGITLYIDDTDKVIDVKTPGNIELKINDTLSTVKLSHPAGAEISIDIAGNVTIKGTTISLNPLV